MGCGQVAPGSRLAFTHEGSDGALASLSAEDREEEHRPLSVSLSAVTLGPGWMWGSSHIRTRVCTHARTHRWTHGTLGRELTAAERAGGIEIAHALHRLVFLKEGVRVPERGGSQWGRADPRMAPMRVEQGRG